MYFKLMCIFVSHLKGKTQSAGVCQDGADRNI
jgi:hypothetical protein